MNSKRHGFRSVSTLEKAFQCSLAPAPTHTAYINANLFLPLTFPLWELSEAILVRRNADADRTGGIQRAGLEFLQICEHRVTQGGTS